MAWYRAGTVAVTNGNATVIGTNTDFVSNTQVGESFIGPNGLSYEIAAVVSATQLTLSDAYQGPSGGGQSYKIQPTQSFARDLALAFAGFKNTFGGILDTIGQGMFGDGTIAAPGIRFAADQDTGLRRFDSNGLAITTGGVDRLCVAQSGFVGIGTSSPDSAVEVSTASPTRGVIARFRSSGGSTGAQIALWQENVATWAVGMPAGSSDFAWWNGRYSGSDGTEIMRLSSSGNLGIGTTSPGSALHISRPTQPIALIQATSSAYTDVVLRLNSPDRTWELGQNIFGTGAGGALQLYDRTVGSERLRVDGSGNLLVGATSTSGIGQAHRFCRSAGVGLGLMAIDNGNQTALFIKAADVDASLTNTAVLNAGSISATGRTMNARGTINASGADYAEYVRKAAGCGRIAKGDVCGIDRNGELVRTWADMLRPVIKSTDPNLVGGDTWAARVGQPPAEPVLVVPGYEGPAEPEEGADRHAYDAARADHAKAVAAAEAAHAAAVEQHAAALAAWQAELEAARQTVDRIAFCGQVPVNVDADTLAACETALADGVAVYLVAIAKGAGIGVTAVREADMTLPAYMKRVGAVWAIRDGRPWVDVQHG